MHRKAMNGGSKRSAAMRVPVTVRLPENVIKQIDEKLDQRDIPLSRNNWLLEAAIEKLRKDTAGESNGTQ
jgi:metal-responsive CopG/Arc/MetJ family transcriptional regulator